MNFLLTQQYGCTVIWFKGLGRSCKAEYIPHGVEVTVLNCPVLHHLAQCVIPTASGCDVGTRSWCSGTVTSGDA